MKEMNSKLNREDGNTCDKENYVITAEFMLKKKCYGSKMSEKLFWNVNQIYKSTFNNSFDIVNI